MRRHKRMPMNLLRGKKDQPRLDLEPSSLQRGLTIVAWLGVGLNVAVIAHYWPLLPEQVPQHFDLQGEVDAWGARWWLLGLPVLSVVLVAGVTVLTRFPHTYNFLWPITERNAARQYELANDLMASIQATTAWIFAMVAWDICRLAVGRPSVVGPFLAPAMVALIFGATGWYFVRAYRER